MRIVVEGPDGAGKTTFIKGLLERHPETFEKAPRFATSEDGPKEGLQERVQKDLEMQMDEGGRVIVYDRHPLVSELIYGPALNRPLARGFNDPHWLADTLITWRAVSFRMVYCLPPRKKVMANVYDSHAIPTEHMQGVRRNIGTIYDLYVARMALDMASGGVGVIYRDYTNTENWPDIVNYFKGLDQTAKYWRRQHGQGE